MLVKKLLIATFLLFTITLNAQVKESVEDVDAHSLQLYNDARWKELITYAKDKVHTGIDFPLLRMRLGYAYFLQGNYAQSLIQYTRVYNAEPLNQTALYYVYLNNVYLNNITQARFYASKLSDVNKKSLAVKELKLKNIEVEFSNKTYDFIRRQDAQYFRVGVSTLLGYKLELQQSGATYNQVIDEPGMIPLGVTNFQNINIQQKEYYAKAIFALTGKLSLIGGYHYVYTPFNNLTFSNNILLGGVQYSTPYINIKALANTATISNANYNQYDVSVTAYPLGNTNLYGISKGAFTNNNSIYTQIIGAKVLKNIWLEANATFGIYDILLDNDALYIYNDIDKKRSKYGASIYASLTKNLLLTLNYTAEEKSKFLIDNLIIKQQNITGGLQWKF